MQIYLTADKIGEETGGGSVTKHELAALRRLGHTEVISSNVYNFPQNPFEQDLFILGIIKSNIQRGNYKDIKLAHVYSGCASQTVKFLKDQGVKVTYTAAAHDKDVSRREHEILGHPFDYPHLTDPALWKDYLEGYLLADRLIVPSTNSRECMQRYGYVGPTDIVPHGVDVPDCVPVFPRDFTVGYLGAIGPDKGVKYLLEAWKKLDYKDDSYLFLAGTHTNSNYMKEYCKSMELKNYFLAGWVPSPAYFYSSISCYAQCSRSEGFGLEVLEAAAYGRPVICSDGAGAHDLVSDPWVFKAGDVGELCDRIDWLKHETFGNMEVIGSENREIAKKYSWDIIENKYEEVWKSLLS